MVFFAACQARATASKLSSVSAAAAALRRALAAAGSIPESSCARARSLAERAAFSEVAGQRPIVSDFSLPPKVYFQRHDLPPAGLTCSARHSASASFQLVARGLAALQASSLSTGERR